MSPSRALLLALAVLVSCDGNCSGSARAPSLAGAPLELPARIAALGSLARPTAMQTLGTLPPAGGAVALPDGATLAAAPGALATPVEVRLQRVDLDLQLLSLDVQSSWAYVFQTNADVPQFGAPVVLQVPRPAGTFAVVQLEGGSWVPRPLPPGPVARVDLTHFSTGALAFIEWWVGRRDELSEAIADGTSPAARSNQLITRLGNDAARRFYGVGEFYGGDTRALCSELRTMTSRIPNATYGFPPDSSLRNRELASFLHAGSAPSDEGGYFNRITRASQEGIHHRVASSPPGSVSPGALLRICVEENGGNVPLGVLACHNYLKDITYLGRAYYPNRLGEMPERFGEAAAALQTIRPTDTSTAGSYDKMGPLYHIFAAMTAGVWFPTGLGGMAAAEGEALLRVTGHQGDVADMVKNFADECGAQTANAINAAATTSPAQPVPGPLPVAPAPVGDGGVLVTDGGLRDAGPRDGGPPQDAGDESVETPFDAGPSPPNEPETWDGHWRGRTRVTMHMSDMAPIVVDQVLDLSVQRAGSTLTLTETGRPAKILQLTPSNPNAATGRGPADAVLGSVAQAHGEYATTVFLHAHRLYLAQHLEVRAVATLGGSGATATNVTDTIGILDRVP